MTDTSHQENPMNPPEPREESLGAAIIELDRTRLPWPARWLLRDGTRARSVLADEIARRVEQRVTPRAWNEAAEQTNARWEKALTAQTDAAADLPAFGSVIACPKCLDQAHGRNTRWCEAQIGGTRPEAMLRTCGCGFSWLLEAPADAPQAQNGPQGDETGPGDATDAEAVNGPHSTTQETGTGPSPAERPDDGDPDSPESPQSDAQPSGRENTRDDGPEATSVPLVPAVTATGGFGDGNPHAKAAEA